MNRNLKLILVFFVAGLITACSSSLTDVQHLEKARNHLENNEMNSAVIELKSALQKNRDNLQARWLLGKLHLELGNAAAAEKELRRATELGLAEGAASPYLAQALLAQGDNEALLKLTVDGIQDRDEKAKVIASQGLALQALGRPEEAAERIIHAMSMNPPSVDVLFAKTLFLERKGDHESARESLDQVFLLDPEYAPAWSLLGDYENKKRNLAQAEKAYSKAIVNRRNNLSDLLKRAEVRIWLNKPVEAQEDINKVRMGSPDSADVVYVQGLIHLISNRITEAQESFERLSYSDRKNFQAQYYLGLFYLEQGNTGQAEMHGKQAFNRVPNAIPVRKLMARINIRNGNYEEAEKLIRPIVESFEDDVEAIGLLEKALLRQDKTDEAIKLLQEVIRLRPGSAVDELRLGVILARAGDAENGLSHIVRSIELDPRLQQARIELVLYHLAQENFDKALEAAEAYHYQYPDIVLAYNLLGRAHRGLGHAVEAEKAFLKVLKLSPGHPSASHHLADLSWNGGEGGERVREIYQEVLKYHKDHLPTLLKLATLDALEENKPAVEKRLIQATTAHPKVVLPAVMLARYYLAESEPDKVAPLFAGLNKQQKNDPDVVIVMSVSQLARRQFAEARSNLEQLTGMQPGLAQAHYLLAQAYAGLNDRKNMRKELETAVKLAPQDFLARLPLARLLILEGEQDKVTEHLNVLKDLSPNNPIVLELEARLAQAQGDEELATELLGELFEQVPSTNSMLSLAQQEWSKGGEDRSLKIQEQWITEHEDDLKARLLLADSYARTDQIDDAINQYQQVLIRNENDLMALNDLAWHLRDKQPKKALEYAERAIELAPEHPVVLDTLAVVLMKNGHIERAKRQMERALLKKPKNPAFRYHGAMIAAEAGDAASALEALQALLDENNDFPEKAQAQQLMAELQAGG